MTSILAKAIYSKSSLTFAARCCVTSIRYSHNVPSYSFKVQDPEDFNERVLKSNVPVVVDFHATWCNPCKLLAPRIESVIDEKEGKVLLAKVDIDEMTDTALEYDVSAVPVLLSFENGKPGDRIIGLQDEDKLRYFVNKFIGE